MDAREHTTRERGSYLESAITTRHSQCHGVHLHACRYTIPQDPISEITSVRGAAQLVGRWRAAIDRYLQRCTRIRVKRFQTVEDANETNDEILSNRISNTRKAVSRVLHRASHVFSPAPWLSPYRVAAPLSPTANAVASEHLSQIRLALLNSGIAY